LWARYPCTETVRFFLMAKPRYPPTNSRCRGSSPMIKRTPLGPYRRPMPGVLRGAWGFGCFLIGELSLYLPANSRRPGSPKEGVAGTKRFQS